MIRYEYRCDACGPFDVTLPMGAAEPLHGCPTCGGPARRRFSAPSVPTVAKPLARARAAEEKSRDEPEVVTAVPPRRRATPAGRPAPKGLPHW